MKIQKTYTTSLFFFLFMNPDMLDSKKYIDIFLAYS